MREIGGYIEFEHYAHEMLHDEAIALNSGRNCLAYILRAKKIKKIALPLFLCDSIKNICEKENIEVRYYHVTADFSPANIDLCDDEWLYVVNYYGQLKKEWVINIADRYNHRIILDNAQAYFEMPISGVDTIYTCRKFFGVPDGAFVYTDAELQETLATDESYDRMHYLLGRFERNASEFYSEYAANNKNFGVEPIKKMSKLTKNLLCGIDYERVKYRRTVNYMYLADALGPYNKLDLNRIEGAFAYPFLLSNGATIRKELLQSKIYIPTLWPNVMDDAEVGMIEYDLALNILPLPCDQRYEIEDMKYLVEEVMRCIG